MFASVVINSNYSSLFIDILPLSLLSYWIYALRTILHRKSESEKRSAETCAHLFLGLEFLKLLNYLTTYKKGATWQIKFSKAWIICFITMLSTFFNGFLNNTSCIFYHHHHVSVLVVSSQVLIWLFCSICPVHIIIKNTVLTSNQRSRLLLSKNIWYTRH